MPTSLSLRQARRLLCVILLAAAASRAQTARVPALFLSDIHFDPYADPAKVAKLNAAPVAEWTAILAAPASPTQKAGFAALQQSCPVRGIDTPDSLWQSSLHAIHAQAFATPAPARFVTISGDLLAHQFDCKYQKLLPAATHEDYLSFVEKTIRYIVNGLRASLPSVPIYVAMGNNDSGCTDYRLNPTHDDFLAATAKIVAEALIPAISPGEATHTAILADFAAGGYFNAPLAAIPHTRLIVLDDLFSSGKYAACSGTPDPTPAATQLAWLQTQFDQARTNHDRVWVLAHIPPGVDLYATARKLSNVCAGAKPVMFLGSEALAQTLAANSDVIRLALFGHTHADEMRLLTHESSAESSAAAPASPEQALGVPVKFTASITPVNGNRPTFTLAAIDPTTASLADYTVIIASNTTGTATTWTKEYTYSAAYHQPAFDAASVARLIDTFQTDHAGATPASQTYLRSYFPGDLSSLLQMVWPQYACSLNHDSAAAFTACTCPTPAKQP